MWNAETTIETCLRSVVRQTHGNWECVVVDDGSTDHSARIVRQYAARDSRVRLVDSPHRGLVASLNLGIDHCRAPFIARIDADDWMHRERLALQVAELKTNPQLCGVGCHVRLFPRPTTSHNGERALPGEADNARKGRGGYEAWINGIITSQDVAREAYIECPIAHPALMIRRDVMTDCRYRDMGWAEDYDLVLRLLNDGASLAVVPHRLLAWRDHEARLSRTSNTYSIAKFIACKAHHLSESLLKDQKEYVLWGYGDTGRAIANALASRGRHPSHIVELHPRRIGNTIRGAPVIHPDDLAVLERKPLVASVAGAGARNEIRAALEAIGYVERKDFVCTA